MFCNNFIDGKLNLINFLQLLNSFIDTTTAIAKMISQNISNIPNFASQAQSLIPIMHRRLSGDPAKKIAISKSLLAQKPFIAPIGEAGADCLTLENFLPMLDARISAEFAYRDEVAWLKDNICSEFNKLCDGVVDEEFIKFTRDQRQRIINAIIDETKIEQKMIVEKFYNDMMNGWDEEALSRRHFNELLYILLWKPFLTPLPIGALGRLKEGVTKLGKEKSSNKIEELTTQFISYLKLNMAIRDVKDNQFKTSENMKTKLEELTKARQICNVAVQDISKSETLINEFKSKCIEKISLAISMKKLLKSEPTIKYDKLRLDGKIDASNVKSVFDKIQKIKELDLYFQGNDTGDEGVKAMSASLKELKDISTLSLNLNYSNIGEEGTKAISTALKELKYISNLELGLGRNNFGAKGAIAISIGLKEMENISNLTMYLEKNNFGEEGANALSTALKELKKITHLYLNIQKNNIGDKGIIAVSGALKELKNISSLHLDIERNNIGEEGAVAVSTAWKELKNVLSLDFCLKRNSIGDNGVRAISAAWKELKNISTLQFDFEDNNIGDEGAKAAAAALNEWDSISTLILYFQNNHIGDVGAKAFSTVLKERKKIPTFNLWLNNNQIKEEGDAALKEVKLASPNYQIYCEIQQFCLL